jgi:hypothetical protein
MVVLRLWFLRLQVLTKPTLAGVSKSAKVWATDSAVRPDLESVVLHVV